MKKLTEMNTDELLDVYCRIAPALEEITQGKRWAEIAEAGKDLTVKTMLTRVLPIILADHREAFYTILAAMNGKTAEEIKAQPMPETMRDLTALMQEDFGDFFAQFSTAAPDA